MRNIKTIAVTFGVLLLAGTSLAQSVVMKGALRREVWGPNRANVTRAQVEAGTAGNPDIDSISLTAFETPDGWGDNYVQRVSGVFIPPTTGRYVFFIAADDDADLFLNLTNDAPAGKVLIAQETVWSNQREWNASGGSSSLTQKRSDTWSPDSGATTPYAEGIQLTAGQSYYIEAVHHEGGGGDRLGVEYKLTTEPDPVDGEPSRITGNLIGVTVTLPTAFGVRTQVQNETAYEGTLASFAFVTTNNASPSLAPTYTWYKNGAVVTNVTGSHYTFPVSLADNNAQVQAVASLAAPISQSVTSAVATLTVNAGSLVVPGLKWEDYADGTSRPNIEAGNTAPPSSIRLLDRFEIPVGRTDNYGTRVSGYFVPPTTGDYIFFVASDDDTDLFLSTDKNPSNKRLVAQETGWSDPRNWNTPGAGDAFMKRSDQWSPDQGITVPWAEGLPLTAGQQYYIEAVHHEGGGGDNLSVTYSLKGAAEPIDGEFTKLAITNNNIQLVTTPVTSLAISTQPQSATVFAGQNATFTVVTTTDGELTPLYQWYRDGVAISNATSSTYRFLTSTADNGTAYTVIASTPVGGLSVTSSVANLTVRTPVFESGLVKYERFTGATRDQVLAGTVGDPDYTTAYSRFEGPEFGDNYANFAARMSGLFIPPTTGRYVFFVNSDDDSDLFVSTDENPTNKRLVAQESGWSGARNWVGVGGGSTPEQKRSDSWTDAEGNAPYASGIQLTAGTRYYIEQVMHEGSGGDNMAATYKLVSDPDPASGDATKLTGNVIGFYAPAASYVQFQEQPASATANSGTTATFSAKAVSDSIISIGGDTNQLVMYKWLKNGADIPGATGPTYTTPLLTAADNNATYVAAARALGIAQWSNSAPATLTVIADAVKPKIVQATLFTNTMSEVVLSLGFDELMNSNSLATAANYTVSGATVTGVSVAPTSRSVLLTLSGAPTSMNVTVNNVTDFSGNALESPSTTAQRFALAPADVGFPGTDPVFPGVVYVDGPNAFTMSAQGSDIWNNSDAFLYLYEEKTGNFDVVVRQESITQSDNWAKGGLMLRESLAPGSRHWSIFNTPQTGANVTSAQARQSTDGASVEWHSAGAAQTPYPNAWVRIARTNNTISVYNSPDGANWTLRGTQTSTAVGDMTALPATVLIGIAVTGHANDTPGVEPYRFWNTSVFDDYNSNYVFVPAPENPTIALTREGGTLRLTYSGTLQSSETADGAYTDVAGASSPYTVDASTGSRFFRSRN